MECPRKVERRIGRLESFNTKPGEAQARVRLGDTLFNLPAMSRGVLQQGGGTMLCANGSRYDVIARDTLIAFDLIFDAEGKNPVPGVWAPKLGPQQ